MSARPAVAAGSCLLRRALIRVEAHRRTTVWLAAPDRRLVLTVNDLDEPLPGPVEWDVQRLAASLVIAGRDNDRHGSV
ncbi:DUF2252 family protein [Nocardia salmonicida]|uniref:DUF2252 family protein n=1 Tax=Nocardia salmonicida TaxID=53431 RepID=UPI0037BA222B